MQNEIPHQSVSKRTNHSKEHIIWAYSFLEVLNFLAEKKDVPISPFTMFATLVFHVTWG